MTIAQQAPGIFVVVVLYKTAIAESSSVTTLRAALATHREPSRFRILVYDNSAEAQGAASVPPDILYYSDPRNAGLSSAYNLAARLAREQGFSWLLTLDQDSELPASFLTQLSAVVDEVDTDARVAAILPRIVQGARLLSPNWFLFDLIPRFFPAGFHGVSPHSGYGFNSAATLRVAAIDAIGGYSPRFSLDYSDAYLFRKLHLSGFQTFIAGEIAVEHHLSMLDTAQMSDERYRAVLFTGSAFCDLMRGPLVGAQFTGTTLKSWVASVLRRRSPEKRAILAELLRQRLFMSKARRIAQWDAWKAL